MQLYIISCWTHGRKVLTQFLFALFAGPQPFFSAGMKSWQCSTQTHTHTDVGSRVGMTTGGVTSRGEIFNCDHSPVSSPGSCHCTRYCSAPMRLEAVHSGLQISQLMLNVTALVKKKEKKSRCLALMRSMTPTEALCSPIENHEQNRAWFH